MTNSSSAAPGHATQDTELWQSLKCAIANSSGFKSWCTEQSAQLADITSVEQKVRLYLRETLETLAN